MKTYGFAVFAEKLSPNTPQVVSARTCRQCRVGSPTRWALDQLLSNRMRSFPFAADLLAYSLLAKRGDEEAVNNLIHSRGSPQGPDRRRTRPSPFLIFSSPCAPFFVLL